MTSWSLLHMRSPLNTVAPGTGQYRALTLASSRKLQFVSGDAATLSFEMPAVRQAAAIETLVDDVLAFREGEATQRFRVVTRAFSKDGGVRKLAFTAVSYRALLDAWIVHDGDMRSWTADTEQTAIAWALIQQGQTRLQGNLGITRGVLPVIGINRKLVGSLLDGGVRPDYFSAGMKRSDAINAIAALDNGFEWDIEPDPNDPYRLQKFNTWNVGTRNQHVGTPSGRSPLLLNDGGSLASWTHTITPTDYADVIRFTGAETTDSNGGAATAIKPVWQPTSQDPADLPTEGRWERDLNNGDLTTQAAVVAAAPAAYATAHLYVPEITCTLRRGVWKGPSQLWIGDQARLLITELVSVDSENGEAPANSSNPDDYLLYIDEDVPVIQLSIDVDEQGAEDVTLGLVRRTFSTATNTRVVNDRLKRLERR